MVEVSYKEVQAFDIGIVVGILIGFGFCGLIWLMKTII